MFQRGPFRPASGETGCASDDQHLAAGARSKSQLILHSSCRRIVIAVATLRLTTSSSTPAVSTSASSLTAALRSLLFGCYYVIAFTSLLMLIVYINHLASQQSGACCSPEEPASLVTKIVPSYANNSSFSAGLRAHVRRRRAASGLKKPLLYTDAELPTVAAGAGLKGRGASARGAIRPKSPLEIAAVGGKVPANSDGRAPPRSPVPHLSRLTNESEPMNGAAARPLDLSERQASFSTNNRGMPSGPTAKLSADNQWIPIVDASGSLRTDTRTSHALGPVRSALSSTVNYAGERPALRRPLSRPPQRPQIPRPAAQEHRWRRPRLNADNDGAGSRHSKLYKRVLLRDKTLASLDYIRSFGAEPRPHGPSEDDFHENTVEFEPTWNQPADKRLGNASLDEPASSSRRSYLADEDPLVKCDMWDLEKGIKNRKPPRELLQMAVRADFDTVRDAINRCRQLSERTLPPDDEYRDGIEIMSTEDLVSLFSMKRGLIPGTKWCGLGDQASSYNDLGPKHRIDICCRAHDHCPIRLKPFRNDYGVLNIALYTKSHCDCDADFYRCLREAHSRTADMLGNLYFNVMKLQCMREERMKVCRELKPIALGFERCIRYESSPVKTVFRFTTPPVAY